MLPQIQILPGYHKRFLNGFPWLYNNEIIQSNQTKSFEPGQLVQVLHKNNPVATGYFNKHSLITFRALSWNSAEPIDTEFFSRRLQNALSIRETFYPTPFYRLIHAEADLLPGLIIDRFDSVFVVQINTQGMEKLQTCLLEALKNVFNPTTIYIKKDAPVRQTEGLNILEPEVIGKAIHTLSIIENDTLFEVDISAGQKTGWFYDHRENRKALSLLSKNKTVIDYFCYSGGFSIQAAKQGAKQVIGVDRSESALQNARQSAILNGVSPTCEFICEEVFHDMENRINDKQVFDRVLLDPPAFVKSKKDLIVGLKGYEKLINKGIQLVANQGLLMIASCSYHVKSSDLKSCLAEALHKTQRTGRIVQSLSAGFDHPLHPSLEGSEYLKGFLVMVSNLDIGH